MSRPASTGSSPQAGGVPVSRVNFVQELLDHPQVLANDYVVEIEHDLTGPQSVAAARRGR